MSSVIEYDPLGQYEKFIGIHALRTMCMVPEHWGRIAEEQSLPMKEIINCHYGYEINAWNMTRTTIEENGLYKYTGDPDMSPLCKITTSREVIFFYEYDIMAIRNKDTNETRVVRVD